MKIKKLNLEIDESKLEKGILGDIAGEILQEERFLFMRGGEEDKKRKKANHELGSGKNYLERIPHSRGTHIEGNIPVFYNVEYHEIIKDENGEEKRIDFVKRWQTSEPLKWSREYCDYMENNESKKT
jgi:hypothetical protein